MFYFANKEHHSAYTKSDLEEKLMLSEKNNTPPAPQGLGLPLLVPSKKPHSLICLYEVDTLACLVA
jgi:hypothetical protein